MQIKSETLSYIANLVLNFVFKEVFTFELKFTIVEPFIAIINLKYYYLAGGIFINKFFKKEFEPKYK